MATQMKTIEAGLPRVADFAAATRWSDFPEAIRERALIALYDFAITARAGTSSDTFGMVELAMDALGNHGPCRVAASRHTWAPEAAALLNGTAEFARNFSDTSFHTIIHGGPPVIPAALAVAERGGSSGSDFLAAVVAGYDVAERIGRVLNGGKAALGHYRHGFHTTGTCGAFGATAAAARVAGADAALTLRALCIVGTFTSGVRDARAQGTEAMPFWTHGGRAAANGILSFELARSGLGADLDCLTGPFGFFATHRARTMHPAALTDGLGKDFLIDAYAVKLFPGSHILMPPIEAMQELRARLGSAEVESITLHLPGEHLNIGKRTTDPKSYSQAQNSFPYVAALALIDGDVSVDGLKASIGNPRVSGLARRISLVEDPELSRLANDEAIWKVKVEARVGGETIRLQAGPPAGSPQRPATWPQMRDKAARLGDPARRAQGAPGTRLGTPAQSGAERLEAAIRALPQAGNVAAFAEAFAAI